jgi:hypothetical protein
MAKKQPDKLSIESSKAIAAGMSYGKWKALQGEGPVEEPAKETDAVLRCQYCGDPIVSYDSRGRKSSSRYCSKLCADKAYYHATKARKKKLAADII